jgi:hypothetical protein
VSTAPTPSPYPATFAHIFLYHVADPVTARRAPRSTGHAIRRHPTPEQGRALEKLGHAIEYLIDSRLYAPSSLPIEANQQASQLLMRLSRELFADCPEIVPAGRRLRHWLAKWLPAHPAL